jgi:hypothetical protein
MRKQSGGLPTIVSAVVPWLVSALLFGACLHTLQSVHTVAAQSEPDQYFHLALGRQMAEHGLTRTLPQAEQVAWKDKFTNDYFLFTTLIAGAWKIGGEKTALDLTFILGLTLFILIFAFARRYLPWGVALMIPLLVLLNPSTLSRFLSLRPSLLAEIWMVGLALSIVSRNRVGVALCAFCFPLSYHAIYFPAFVLVVAALVGQGFRNEWPKLAAIGGVALAVGTCVNPYFPGTLSAVGAVFASLLLPSHVPTSESAQEAMGWSKELFLSRLPLFCVILGLTAWRLLAEPLPRTKAAKAAHPLWDPEFVFLFILSASFFGVMLVSFRAIEYAAPFAAVFFAVFAARHTKTVGQTAGVVVAGALLLLPEGGMLFFKPLGSTVDAVALRQAVQALPAEAAGKKVLNCDWFTGGPLLYWAPQVRFVDLGDPKALDDAHPGLSLLKTQLRQGVLPYDFGPARFAFGADYVLCQGGPLVDSMDASPHFRRLYPPMPAHPGASNSSVFTLHEVRDRLHPAFVTGFEQQENGKWIARENGTKLSSEQRSPFQNLGTPDLGRTVASKGMECSTLRATQDELRRHQGADFVGVGGGPAVLVELNGRRLFGRQFWPGFNTLDSLVPLPHKLRANDSLVVKTCRLSSRERMGAAVSLWTSQALKETCEWKGQPLVGPTLGGADFSDKPTALCLASLAARNGAH